ncbi:MAG: Tad domain-containing protein [Thermoanaerobaculia bacterium]
MKYETEALSRIRRRHGERGQVLVFFLLIMVTMILIGVLAVAGGQMLVRRQQAQMIVDAAAFAGASRQAEGLNTIANLNARALWFLHAIQYSKIGPYFDSKETTYERAAAFLLTVIAGFAVSDWAGDVLEDYQKGFDMYNSLIDIANCAYSMPSPIPGFGPRLAAEDVIEANFGSGDKLFRSEDLVDNGIADLSTLVDINLVELTDPETYEIGGYYYLPHPLAETNSPSTCASWPVGTILCAWVYGNYASMIPVIYAYRAIDPIEYELGKFYEDNQDEVRFAYFLEVSSSPVIWGKTFFEDLPPIVVAAAAKPYGGHLGSEFEETWFLYEEEDGKEISPTYKAKLVPLTAREQLALSLRMGVGEDWARWATITH